MKKLSQVDRLKELVKDIDPEVGILDIEGKLLYDLARKLPSGGCIVEIGSWKGRSTIWLGYGAKESGNTVYAVDPHEGTSTHELTGEEDTYIEFLGNIYKAGLDEVVIPLPIRSKEATDDVGGPIHMVFIDGSHEYQDVLEDYISWAPSVLVSGYITLHDTIGYEGPKRVASDLFTSTYFKVTNIKGQIVAAKVTRGSRFNLLFNSGMYIYWKVYSLLFLLATKLPRCIKDKLK